MTHNGFRTTLGTLVVRGEGAHHRAGTLLDEVGAAAAILVTSPSLIAEGALVDGLRVALGDRLVGTFESVRPHVPWATVEAADDLMVQSGADAVVSVGGGSAIDTAKALIWAQTRHDGMAVRRHLAVPTTLGGAEFTPFAGVTRDGVKLPLRARGLAADVVIHDPWAAATAPPALLRTSVANAVAHCLEGLVSSGAQPHSDACYVHALRLMSRAARRMDAIDLDVLAELQAGGALAAVDPVPMGLAHALVHRIAPQLGVVHGIAHGIVGPAVLEFNAPALASRQRLIVDALHPTPLAPPARRTLRRPTPQDSSWTASTSLQGYAKSTCVQKSSARSSTTSWPTRALTSRARRAIESANC